MAGNSEHEENKKASSSKSHIISVVVLYHPVESECVPRLKKLEQAVDVMILVDNTESGSSWLKGYCDKLPSKNTCSIQLIQPMKNLGIAAAQNLALDSIFESHSEQDLVIFFDQDSIMPIELPSALAREFNRLNQKNDVAAVGPSFIDQEKHFVYHQIHWSQSGIFQRFMPDKSQPQQPVCALISSGMLTNVKTLKIIGRFDSALFMDYVDTDWSLKAQSKGFHLYVIPNIEMQHAIGSSSIRLLGRELSVHSPLRRYYMLRNSFWMAKKPYVSKMLAFSFIYRTLIHHCILIAMTASKLAQAKALLKGIYDGVFLSASTKQLNERNQIR